MIEYYISSDCICDQYVSQIEWEFKLAGVSDYFSPHHKKMEFSIYMKLCRQYFEIYEMRKAT